VLIHFFISILVICQPITQSMYIPMSACRKAILPSALKCSGLSPCRPVLSSPLLFVIMIKPRSSNAKFSPRPFSLDAKYSRTLLLAKVIISFAKYHRVSVASISDEPVRFAFAPIACVCTNRLRLHQSLAFDSLTFHPISALPDHRRSPINYLR